MIIMLRLILGGIYQFSGSTPQLELVMVMTKALLPVKLKQKVNQISARIIPTNAETEL